MTGYSAVLLPVFVSPVTGSTLTPVYDLSRSRAVGTTTVTADPGELVLFGAYVSWATILSMRFPLYVALPLTLVIAIAFNAAWASIPGKTLPVFQRSHASAHMTGTPISHMRASMRVASSSPQCFR